MLDSGAVFWYGFWFAAGVSAFLVLCRILAIGIDWIDAWSSRLTIAEATHRARLTAIGQWPPSRPRLLTSLEAGRSLMALALLGGLAWILRR